MSNQNMEFCLDSKCAKNLPIDKYEQNFTFIVNGKQYQTSRIVADLLSPRIRKFHYSDPSINEFIIDVKIGKNENNIDDYFKEFLSLSTFNNMTIEPTHQQYFLQYFYLLGNIDEYYRLQPDYLQTISIVNILDRLQSFTKTRYEINEILDSSRSSIIFDKLIEYAAEHFEELDKEKMKTLPNEVIEEIIRNEKLKFQEEDSLLDFLLKLYENDRSYSNLFENVLFINVSEEKLSQFVNEFDVEYINNQIFHSICNRFFSNKRYEMNNKDRYINVNIIKRFTPKDDDYFNGIFRYLTNKTGGNIHDNGTIEVSSNSVYSSNYPKNSVDYQNSNIFHDNNASDTYLLFDLKDKSILLSGYSIQSAPSNVIHLKNWVVEVSQDNKNWEEIDRHSNDSTLNGENNKSRFEIQKPQTEFSRFLRIRQTGEGWNSNYFGFCFFEVYGKLQEPKQ